MVTNEQLVSRIRAGEDTEKNMALLYDQVKDFIRSIAWQYRETGEFEDLLQVPHLCGTLDQTENAPLSAK